MNIYAQKNDKVICTTLSGGYSSCKETANKYLSIDSIYTIDYTIVDSWSTDVYLLEFPNIKFNSVFFEDHLILSNEKNHPDYNYYN